MTHARQWALAIGATLTMLLCIGSVGVGAALVQEPITFPSGERQCFPARSWGPAPDRIRPCVEVTHLWEDGSIRVKVTDADGRYRWTGSIGAKDR